MGTDETGLRGAAIVMNKESFTQNMSSDDAMRLDMGTESLSKKAFQKYYNNYTNLSSRPDWDGIITLSEANNWYRNGNGEPLFVDAAKIDLSPLEKSDFSTVGSSKYVNFLDPKKLNLQTGLVYGTILVTLMNNDGAVKLGNNSGLLDVYNFDMQQGRPYRNFATQLGSIIAGNGTSFNIYHYGQGKVK